VSVTRLAVACGLVVVVALCWLAAVGSSAATEVVVTVFVLAVLVGGGNWLSGRSVPPRPPAPGTATGAVEHGTQRPEGPPPGTGGSGAPGG